jgi:FtsP/CotA-like multicopper oxidase with cupredoxin domain
MSTKGLLGRSALVVGLACLGMGGLAHAQNLRVQCPGDVNDDAVIDVPNPAHPNAKCMHLAAGDGFINMADGKLLYTFGFSDWTGKPADQVPTWGLLSASFPAPTVMLDEGDEFYLTLTNVGMAMRPDLFDPHSVHFHGFPQAAPVFDGMPEGSFGINMMASLTYYYNLVEPGTYMYHCHVEATEHMQMGMLGNLYVRPAQNRRPNGTVLGTHVHSNPDWNAIRSLDDPLVGDKYAYDDGDGSTRYDVEVPIQLTAMDGEFHDLHLGIQPLPFAYMRDNYPMLNGRGYPDTINPAVLMNTADEPKPSQKVNAIVRAAQGQTILLRISSLSVTNYYTLATAGLSMKVVGWNARHFRGPDPDGGGPLLGKNLYYDTNSVTIGGGESVDVLIDTTGIPAGTYPLYTTNLNFLNNDTQDLGGMMTEIVIVTP